MSVSVYKGATFGCLGGLPSSGFSRLNAMIIFMVKADA